MIDKNSILLQTKKKLFSTLIGEHNSIFSGNGLEFKQLREYTTNDDIRHINWKKTSKSLEPSVNIFDESRQLDIVLVYLNSGSLYFGTKQSKQTSAAEVFISLSKAVVLNGDLLTSVFFSKDVDIFHKPTKDKSIVDINLETIKSLKTLENEIDYNKLTNYLLHKIKKKSLIFLVGDFLDFDENSFLSKASYKHEIYCAIIRDVMEEDLNLMGEFDFIDTNTNISKSINLNKKTIQKYNKAMKEYDDNLYKYLNANNIKYQKIYTHTNSVDGVKALVIK